MRKLTFSVLSLLLLISISHGTLPSEKTKDIKTKAFISMDQVHEDLPGPGKEDKKLHFIMPVLILLVLSRFFLIKEYKNNWVTALIAFLTAVFFQSNYVIKPL